MTRPRLLVVSSAATELPLANGRRFRTGYCLSELALPLDRLLEAGYRVDIATPEGRPPAPDPHSLALLPARARAAQLAFVERTEGMREPVPIESLHEPDLARYAGLFVPGGHAQMVDLPRSDAMARILLHFHEARKLTCLICHGPAALLSMAGAGRPFPYAGYALTCFPSWMEHLLEYPFPVLGGRLPWYLDKQLAALGMKLRKGAVPGMPLLIEDRELLTGQDPFSAQALGERMVQRLEATRARDNV